MAFLRELKRWFCSIPYSTVSRWLKFFEFVLCVLTILFAYLNNPEFYVTSVSLSIIAVLAILFGQMNAILCHPPGTNNMVSMVTPLISAIFYEIASLVCIVVGIVFESAYMGHAFILPFSAVLVYLYDATLAADVLLSPNDYNYHGRQDQVDPEALIIVLCDIFKSRLLKRDEKEIDANKSLSQEDIKRIDETAAVKLASEVRIERDGHTSEPGLGLVDDDKKLTVSGVKSELPRQHENDGTDLVTMRADPSGDEHPDKRISCKSGETIFNADIGAFKPNAEKIEADNPSKNAFVSTEVAPSSNVNLKDNVSIADIVVSKPEPTTKNDNFKARNLRELQNEYKTLGSKPLSPLDSSIDDDVFEPDTSEMGHENVSSTSAVSIIRESNENRSNAEFIGKSNASRPKIEILSPVAINNRHVRESGLLFASNEGESRQSDDKFYRKEINSIVNADSSHEPKTEHGSHEYIVAPTGSRNPGEYLEPNQVSKPEKNYGAEACSNKPIDSISNNAKLNDNGPPVTQVREHDDKTCAELLISEAVSEMNERNNEFSESATRSLANILVNAFSETNDNRSSLIEALLKANVHLTLTENDGKELGVSRKVNLVEAMSESKAHDDSHDNEPCTSRVIAESKTSKNKRKNKNADCNELATTLKTSVEEVTNHKPAKIREKKEKKDLSEPQTKKKRCDVEPIGTVSTDDMKNERDNTSIGRMDIYLPKNVNNEMLDITLGPVSQQSNPKCGEQKIEYDSDAQDNKEIFVFGTPNKSMDVESPVKTISVSLVPVSKKVAEDPTILVTEIKESKPDGNEEQLDACTMKMRSHSLNFATNMRKVLDEVYLEENVSYNSYYDCL